MSGDVSLFAQVGAYIDSLVHPSARLDPLAAARHRAFIAPRLIGGLLVLTALPIHLALSGVPGTLEIFIYAWLRRPVLIAWYLSRTGRYEVAQIMSSVALAALIATIGLATGGITSFAAVWLVLIPLEAALSAIRRVVMVASAIAIGAARLLYSPVRRNWSRSASPAALMAAGDRIRRALCDRSRARQRIACARKLAPARRRGGPLSAARPQHRRRDHAPPSQRYGAVCLAGGRVAVRHAGEIAAWSWAVRPRARGATVRLISPRWAKAAARERKQLG